MKIIPAIDLIDGKCVRLYQGDFSRTTQVGMEPEAQLNAFIRDGADMIHIVDLEGARSGKGSQLELITRLCGLSSVPIEVGGGIRNMETVERLLEAGASRLVLGTSALEDGAFLKAVLKAYPEHIVIGIDAKAGKVAVRGWETVSEIDFIDFARKMEELGVKTIVFTDISKDGTLSGPNLQSLQEISQAVDCKIVASGGIKDMEDIRNLEKIGIEEAIVGKAIYDGRVWIKGDVG
ncbi:1-(5-phosphoribosyl)-5-[(5-phosphoribosylamino)methylideneamino]imidazole-4-carboxamide isomerase [Sediminibacillus dalangtanensis]|uniref:1-(5-phosphoribosyl)-5-[(5-phosphoribosylamino)methylideneamino] imidazole-4-carboxamide isomerase n=1 Tax=Sediminibacillus dalangtanensis TaxID=2729421 RepID=A0ABX7VRJ2_9BACI|nr:1-(5-phosphoribosyl)-5-[(5-phosphoribosylamino)methylideneamino]imidazole-4-carboxamide isomerase [Sediminibacillus dalangtanensis]QTM99542.1 1-(5-phosphoribosyl)-5-[(5-phosphoribosylamino)methylideneamino]imidazole-4-carboxamide isomerase [Sediminibacillus dalangtanensis]